MRNGDYLGNGIGPVQIGTAGSGTLVVFPGETYQTPLLDLTQITLGIELIPAKLGHIPRLSSSVSSRWMVESFSGTQVTPATLQAGSDAAHSNFIAPVSTSPDNASVNAANPISFAQGPAEAAVTTQKIPGAPVIFDVVAPCVGTGLFSLKARFACFVTWVAVG